MACWGVIRRLLRPSASDPAKWGALRGTGGDELWRMVARPWEGDWQLVLLGREMILFILNLSGKRLILMIIDTAITFK